MIRRDVTFRGERFLVVDDEPAVGACLAQSLEWMGASVRFQSGARAALGELRRDRFDAVLTDVRMPDVDGIELLERAKAAQPDVPIVLMTGQGDLECARRALRNGAEDLLLKPIALDELRESLERVLNKRRTHPDPTSMADQLLAAAEAREAELASTRRSLESLLSDREDARLETFLVLAKIAESNDPDTGNHVRRVSRLSGLLARAAGLGEDQSRAIATAAPLHDLGKIAVDPRILRKRGPLTAHEFEEMKAHTWRGARILEGVEFLSTARDIALGHHERVDGSGYPRHLVGDEIPLSARIVSIADVFDALTSARCYKPAWPVERAFDYLWQHGDRQFDLELVEAFTARECEVAEILRELASPPREP